MKMSLPFQISESEEMFENEMNELRDELQAALLKHKLCSIGKPEFEF